MYLSRYLLSFSKLVLISGLLNSCTAAGQQEFQLYSQAYDVQYVQADAVLQAVGSAERSIWTSRQPRVSKFGYFEPNDAAYYIDAVEPPKTAAIRASLLVVKNYNEAMIALASGENAKALTAKISTLTINVASAALAVAALTTPSATTAQVAASNTGRFAKAMTGYLDYLPFVAEVANIASREAFRKQLIESYPTISNILLTMRNDGTRVMYEVLRTPGDNGVDTPAPKTDAGAQKLLAGWVLLLDKTNLALEAAVNAARTGSQINLDSLSQASVELTVLAEQVRAAKLEK
ncbi:hypothetical protein [Rhizobium ruizarguesonis]|uniref:hypothetical protein n=1 Tax=Rhizobium ruizarguesonis TaxID=2081791 RepID=UPI0010325023|nr:hypothetical protein [Rhizobium ruizarguesonis]TBE02324.1 hypothetical protein ELH10_15640 [Rhizobium ruizarguesonis]TBF14701.1 hypothetical protein ELG95_14790 [Rhizobium ruizarguesonis]